MCVCVCVCVEGGGVFLGGPVRSHKSKGPNNAIDKTTW